LKLEKTLLRSGEPRVPAAPSTRRWHQPFSSSRISRSAAIAASMQPLIDDLPEEIAVLDDDCGILAVNQAWMKSAAKYGHGDLLPGCSYRDFCVSRAADYEPAARTLAGLDEILSGKRQFWQMYYNGQERWSGREFQLSMRRMKIGAHSFLCVTRVDLTELVELRRIKRESGTSVIEGQAAERQRMARELHDSTSQLLASIGLTLGRLRHEMTTPQSMDMMADMQALLADTHREIRAISFLAHPPALKEQGLAEALEALVNGFARRVDLVGWFEMLGDPVPLSAAMQTTIYRIAQEAMTNIRHANATRVRLSLCFRPLAIHLVIADDGIGISSEATEGRGEAGVGLASMRERLAELGGRLSFRKLFPGTAVVASLPTTHPTDPPMR
jgi:two-component system, NarL family, sensor kinase